MLSGLCLAPSQRLPEGHTHTFRALPPDPAEGIRRTGQKMVMDCHQGEDAALGASSVQVAGRPGVVVLAALFALAEADSGPYDLAGWSDRLYAETFGDSVHDL